MRRLVLILGLAVLGWLGRRQLRSAADAQRYLTLLALLQIIAVMGKASPKSQATELRLNTVVMPALGAVGPIGAAGNASFLATLSAGTAPGAAAGQGDTHMPTAGASYSQSTEQGAYNRINDLLDWTGFMATDYNNLRSALLSSGIIT
ncbi:MAG TPA: hypothetical protein VK586_24765 [Streptosporangiaceae bacterium]|nr:hypothetical protein [Streptosporangiaceae bacterium]